MNYFVKLNRPPLERKLAFKKLRELGFTHTQAYRMRDFSYPVIQEILDRMGIEVNFKEEIVRQAGGGR